MGFLCFLPCPFSTFFLCSQLHQKTKFQEMQADSSTPAPLVAENYEAFTSGWKPIARLIKCVVTFYRLFVFSYVFYFFSFGIGLKRTENPSIYVHQ
ncbi:unnamed protein product, partial [Prunus brigantina]